MADKIPFLRTEGVVVIIRDEDFAKLKDEARAIKARLAEVERKALALCVEIDRHDIRQRLAATSIHWFKRELSEALDPTRAANSADVAPSFPEFQQGRPGATWKAPRYHCQNGSGDICLAGNRDGICCAPDECDIDSGTRPDPRAAVTVNAGEVAK